MVSTKDDFARVNNYHQIYDKSLLLCNFTDFIELVSVNRYFMSGVIGICIPDDVSIQNRLVNIIENSIKNIILDFYYFLKKIIK